MRAEPAPGNRTTAPLFVANEHFPNEELLMRRALPPERAPVRPAHLAAAEPLDGDEYAVEAPRARGPSARIALLDPIEPRRVVEVPQVRERERVADAAPEVVLGDHRERDEATVGGTEDAVAG